MELRNKYKSTSGVLCAFNDDDDVVVVGDDDDEDDDDLF
jgi:hypothetical protein